MAWNGYNTRILARAYNEGSGYDKVVELPIDTLEVKAEPYVSTGSTVQELYDHRRRYRVETYGYVVNLNYAFERTTYQSDRFNMLHELVGLLHERDYMDLFVNYEDGEFENQNTNAGAVANYKCVKMIPNVTEDMAPKIFQNRAEEKPRELELVSNQRDYEKSDVNWIFE